MEDCTLCMDCAVSCENVAFNLTKPSSVLFNKFKTQKVEVWTILILTAILSFAMTFKHSLNRTAIADEFIWNKISKFLEFYITTDFISIDGLSVFLFSIVLIVVLNIIAMFIASKILKVSFETTFYTLGYAFAPLFIIGGLSHIGEFFFYSYASNIVNGFNQGFSLGMNTMPPLASRKDEWVHIFKLFTHIGYIWAFILMAFRLKLLDTKKHLKIIAFPFASALIIFYMSLNFYTSYVFKTYGVNKTGHNHTNQKTKEE